MVSNYDIVYIAIRYLYQTINNYCSLSPFLSFLLGHLFVHNIIAGLLKQPTNLTVVTRTHLSVHLKWTPPFTLNVSTQQEPAIQHYVIFLTKTINGREEREEIMTANSSYTYNRQHFSHCLKINFQVAAVNQVGRGNLSVNLDTSFLEREFT